MNIWNDPQDEDDLDPEYHPELDDRGAPPLEEPRPVRGKRPGQKLVTAPVQDIEEAQLAEILEDVEDEEADHEAALSDARLRLEMGRLYEMVMGSSLFSNLDADQQAIKNVQRQIKRFAKEQMEVMLGMRAPKAEVGQIVSPFNEMEIEVLKKLAFTATKGASAASGQSAAKVHMAPLAPKKTTLTPIGHAPAKPIQAPKKIEVKATRPIERKAAPKRSPVVEQESDPLEKSVSEMTEEELIARNTQIAERQAQRKAVIPADRLPPMPPEAMNAMYTARVTHDKNAAAVSTIVALLNKD